MGDDIMPQVLDPSMILSVLMRKTLLWIVSVGVVAGAAITLGDPKANALYLLRALIPSGVAIKIVQGLAVVHEIKATDVDYRYKRQLSAFQDLSRDLDAATSADPRAVPITSIGRRFLGRNDGDSFGTLMGYSTALGGDVTGDGRADVVSGGYEYSDTVHERGIVYVVHSDSSFERSVQRIVGSENRRAWFGHSVANNGDFDGDGLSDVLVGARFDNGGKGAAYLITGDVLDRSDADVSVDLAPSVRRYTYERFGADLGFEVYFGDDWDEDGRNELVIRAHIEGVQTGGVFIVFSSIDQTGNDVDLGRSQGVVSIVSSVEYGDLGRSIALIEDLDGDGSRELLLGAQTASAYFGVAEHVASNVHIALSSYIENGKPLKAPDDLLILGEQSQGDQLGSCVGSAGDVDGDGTVDFVIGARHANAARGLVYVVSGRSVLELGRRGVPTPVEAVTLLQIVGERANDRLGWSCADINADFDDDGLLEISVGARSADGSHAAESGAVYVVPGSMMRSAVAEGAMQISAAEPLIVKIGAVRHGSRLGSKRRFSSGGDFDGDGIPDMAIGTPGLHEGGMFAGAVWVVSGAKIRTEMALVAAGAE